MLRVTKGKNRYVAVWWLVLSVATLMPFDRVVISIIINKKFKELYGKA